MYEKAIELEPAFAAAYAYLGWSYYLDWVTQWSRSAELLERAFQLRRKALVLDDGLAMAYRLLGHVGAHKNQYFSFSARALVRADRSRVPDARPVRRIRPRIRSPRSKKPTSSGQASFGRVLSREQLV
jgi:hypothetical protein